MGDIFHNFNPVKGYNLIFCILFSGDNDVNLIIDERDLAEHGRDRLLDKADVWEQKQRENPSTSAALVSPVKNEHCF